MSEKLVHISRGIYEIWPKWWARVLMWAGLMERRDGAVVLGPGRTLSQGRNASKRANRQRDRMMRKELRALRGK